MDKSGESGDSRGSSNNRESSRRNSGGSNGSDSSGNSNKNSTSGSGSGNYSIIHPSTIVTSLIFRILICIVVVFPALDTLSVFPLICNTLGNSLHAAFPSFLSAPWLRQRLPRSFLRLLLGKDAEELSYANSRSRSTSRASSRASSRAQSLAGTPNGTLNHVMPIAMDSSGRSPSAALEELQQVCD